MAKLVNQQAVVFSINGRTFGLELDRVDCIIEKNAVTPVPNAPSAVEGAVFYRDRILAVVNLRELLQMDGSQDGNLMVVVKGEGEDFALSADRIYGIIPSERLMLKYIPSGEREHNCICGIGEFNGMELFLLDFNCQEDLKRQGGVNVQADTTG